MHARNAMKKIMNTLYERKLMQWIKIFLLLLFFKKIKKNGVEGRDAQYISLCALNQVQYGGNLRH